MILVCFVVVGGILVVLHAVIALCVAGVRRRWARKGGDAIKRYDSADHFECSTATVDTNMLIVLTANRRFAEKYGTSASDLIGKRLPRPVAPAVVALRCPPVTFSVVNEDEQTGNSQGAGTSVRNARFASQRP
jgi:hypothetical protein